MTLTGPNLPAILHTIRIAEGLQLFVADTYATNPIQVKWSTKINEEIEFRIVAVSFKVNYRTTSDAFSRFKLVHKRVMRNKLFHEINLVPDTLCFHCREVETIVHTFLECSHVINIWRQAEIWIRKHIDKHAKLSHVE